MATGLSTTGMSTGSTPQVAVRQRPGTTNWQSMRADWSPKVVWRVIQLYQSGKTPTQIHAEFNNVTFKTIYSWCTKMPKKVAECKKTGLRGSGAGRKTELGAALEMQIGLLWAAGRKNMVETTRRWMLGFVKVLSTNPLFQQSESWFRNVRRYYIA